MAIENFETRDDSRNNRLIAFALLGEGWHNNHHRFPRAARHGISLVEPDPIYWALRAFQAVGAIRDLHPNPAVQDDRRLRRCPSATPFQGEIDSVDAAVDISAVPALN